MRRWWEVTVTLPSYRTMVISADTDDEAIAEARLTAADIYAEVEKVLGDYGSPIYFGPDKFEIVDINQYDPKGNL